MIAEDLISFENEVAELFKQGKIRAPVHLSGGNEYDLIEIFSHIKPDDWVFSTHRSHLHALLKGIPKDWLMNEILNGRSISLMSKEHKFFSSGIVGGCLPIAVGVAMAGETVWVFVGDMAAETGMFHECLKYAAGQNLMTHFVVEDNGKSVNSPTKQVWRYSYENTFNHQGVGSYVIF